MRSDLVYSWACLRIVWEETQNELLKMSTHRLTVDLLEVEVDLARDQQVIEVLFLSSLFEGENSLHDDKQDDSKWEQINHGSLINFSFLYLRSHVSHGAAVAL